MKDLEFMKELKRIENLETIDDVRNELEKFLEKKQLEEIIGLNLLEYPRISKAASLILDLINKEIKENNI